MRSRFKHKNIRNEGYLKIIRGLPCLICGRGAEAHHLMCVGERGLGYRSGDNWAVPLCRNCHTNLHRFGNEKKWWNLEGIDVIKWAKKNWDKYNGSSDI